jgi:hypothetical protein
MNPTPNTRPSNVVRFEQLMYLTVGVEIVQFLWQLHADDFDSGAIPLGLGFILNVFSISFMVVFIYLTARLRTNWARWILLLIFVFSTDGYLRSVLPYYLTHGPDIFALSLAVSISAQLAAFIFIFTGNSREWFGASRFLNAVLEAIGVRSQSKPVPSYSNDQPVP